MTYTLARPGGKPGAFQHVGMHEWVSPHSPVLKVDPKLLDTEGGG